MMRTLEIDNVYELYADVVTRVEVDIRPRADGESDADWDAYLYETIHPLTGVGHENGGSAYFIKSIDGLEPVIDEEYGL